MRLHIERHGQGPDLVLLHGWGLHGGVFDSIAPPLAEHFRLHLVDLPGHGRSSMDDALADIHTLAAGLLAALPQDALWLGWSLGGRIALSAALQRPLAGLILVGSTPCFCQRQDWPHGMPEHQFGQFTQALQQDYRATLHRFIALQSRGSSQGREELRRLREVLFAHGEPSPAALQAGLSLLSEVDLRPSLPQITTPSLVLHGRRDTLAPQAAAEYLANQLPNARLALIDGAGHAPFISHPEQFIQALMYWHRTMD